MIRLLLVDNHTILRQGLRLLLSEETSFSIVGEAACGREAIAKAIELEPNVITMDIGLPRISGIEAARQIHTLAPECHALFLSSSATDDDLLGAIQAGARGFLSKSADANQLIEAIQRVHAGERVFPPATLELVAARLAAPQSQPLTGREMDTLALMGTGMTNSEIADVLGISQNTVKTHVRHILEKLQLRNRSEAAAYIARTRLHPHQLNATSTPSSQWAIEGSPIIAS